MAGFHHTLFNYSAIPGAAPGQTAYTSPGTYSWIAPADVTNVSVVAIGGGGGAAPLSGSVSLGNLIGGQAGAGGGLGWKNNISVTPGQSYTVVVGAGGTTGVGTGSQGINGENSYFIDTNTVAGFGGAGGGNTFVNSSSYVGTGGGTGGTGGTGGIFSGVTKSGGGGGAGGYSGAGGNGASAATSTASGSAGAGGAGGGGGANGGGGGVGLLGQGTSGAGGINTAYGCPGQAGSGGTNGGDAFSGAGGNYGGGGNGRTAGGIGSSGAVRIIWAGNRTGAVARAFPATNVGNL